MSTLALAPRWAKEVGGEPTLEALLEHAWAALSSGAPAVCPVCEATMEPVRGPNRGPEGHCMGCGSVLS